MLVILAGVDQKNSCCGMFKTGLTGCAAPRAVSVSLVRRPVMLGIMARMDQDDSCVHFALCPFPWLAGLECSAFLPVWTRRTVARGVHYSALSLVRSWIHALRQSTELVKQLTCFQVCLRFQRSAWFGIGYMRCVSPQSFLEEFWVALTVQESVQILHASLGQVDDMPAGVSFFRAVYTGTRPG